MLSFLPSAGQIAGLFCVVANLVLFAALGAAVGGRKRFAAADIVVGWGVASTIFILGGVLLRIPFSWITLGLWLAAIPGGWLA